MHYGRSNHSMSSGEGMGEGNLRPRRPPREYLGEYSSRGKPKIPLAGRILMNLGHTARKNPSDNADLGFQAVGPALRIMQLNVEGLSAAKRHIIQTLAEIHHIDVICLQETPVNDDKSDRLTISGFDIISYTHSMPNMDVRHNVRSDVSHASRVVVSVLRCHSRGWISHCQHLQTTN